jgi:methylmalonyl-CoA mutase N-terminal domain/subunit
MEALIESIIKKIDEAGGMYRAVESGLVQQMIGDSALAFQNRVESGEQTVVGVNKYRVEEESAARAALQRPNPETIERQLERLARYRKTRDRQAVERALDDLSRAANSADQNVYASVVGAAVAGATHGEIVAVLRREMGNGEPLIIP